ncbi:MAG: MFS transporter [Pseudomonadota bacterium]
MTEYRNVLALIFAVGFLQLAGGLIGVITPLGLDGMGVGAPLIGVVAALHAVGFMVGAWTAPRMMSRIGNIRVYSAAAALNTASILAMALVADPIGRGALRLLQGVVFAWMFTSIESWLSSSTPAAVRGGVTGFYHVVAKAALLIGPFMAAGATALSPDPLLFAGIFCAVSLVPICMTRRDQPAPPRSGAISPVALFRLAPAAVIGAFAAGLINTGTTALLPLLAQSLLRDGESATTAAAQIAAAAWIGGLLSQWPAGRFSDRVDRRSVVAGMAFFSAIVALILAAGFAVFDRSVLLILIAVWGAGSLSSYGVSVAHGIDRAEIDEIPQLMSGLLFVWAIGSVVGPPLSGAVMRTSLGPAGLFVFAAIGSFLLTGTMLVRRQAREPVPDADAERWEIAQPLSVAGGELDPRNPTTPGDAKPFPEFDENGEQSPS